MSSLSYKKLFKLELRHDFYTDGNCPDFNVIPSAETSALFLKLKIKTVGTETGLIALYEDRNGTPSSPITAEVRFSFGLQLKTPTFTNYTDLAAKNSTADKYRYYSTGGSFTKEVIPVFPNLINYEFSLNSADSGSGAPVTVFVKKGSVTVLTVVVESYDHTGGTYHYRAQLDLKNSKSGIYEIFRQGSSTALLEMLVDPSLSSSQIFAVVDIFKGNNNEVDYSIQFNSKKVQWKYFLVFKNGGSVGTYSVDGTASSGPIAFTLASPDSDDLTVISTIIQQHPDAVVKIFKSPNPPLLIPFSETSRKGVALKKGTDEIIPNLPNPNPKAAKPEMFVYVDN